MHIVVIGTGYVGLVTGVCFAELGNHVIGVDIDTAKISALKKGRPTIYEPFLEELLISNIKKGRLNFVTSLKDISISPDSIIIAVDTPNRDNHTVDTDNIFKVALDITHFLKEYCLIILKSTVPPGVTFKLKEYMQNHMTTPVDVVCNPEFLSQGNAIHNFMNPSRIIFGIESIHSKKYLEKLYAPIIKNTSKIYFLNYKEAEMTKYAANAMLASRISLINELALVCDHLKIDIEKVRESMGADVRIGHLFNAPGCGYGGSCFPKDLKALTKLAEDHGINPILLRGIEERNTSQKQIITQKIIDLFGNDLSEINICMWGLSFKPFTDDIREATALVVLTDLLKRNATIKAYDPVAIERTKNCIESHWVTSGQLSFVKNQNEGLINADVLVLVTEWPIFVHLDLAYVKKIMRRPIILDGRNQYNPELLKAANFQYHGIGRG